MTLMAFMETMSMNGFPLIAAFFIGLMTALSPCPLATNITAIAYVISTITILRCPIHPSNPSRC